LLLKIIFPKQKKKAYHGKTKGGRSRILKVSRDCKIKEKSTHDCQEMISVIIDTSSICPCCWDILLDQEGVISVNNVVVPKQDYFRLPSSRPFTKIDSHSKSRPNEMVMSPVKSKFIHDKGDKNSKEQYKVKK